MWEPKGTRGQGRDGRHLRGLFRPHQQDGAGSVIDDEPGRGAQTAWAQAGAVPVSSNHQKVDFLGGRNHLFLYPPAPRYSACAAAQARFGCPEQVCGRFFCGNFHAP